MFGIEIEIFVVGLCYENFYIMGNEFFYGISIVI